VYCTPKVGEKPTEAWGDSAAPIVAGGMVHVALAAHAAADSLSQNPNSCAAAFLSCQTRTIPRNAIAIRGTPKIPIPNSQTPIENRKPQIANRKSFIYSRTNPDKAFPATSC